MKNKSIKIIIALFIALVTSAFAMQADSAAAYSPAEITKKALMQDLEKCYNGGAIQSSLTNIGATFKGADSLYTGEKVSSTLPLPTSKNGTYHKIDDNDLDCGDVIKGWRITKNTNTIQSSYKVMGHPAPTGNDAAEWLITYGGYQVSLGSAKQCVKFQFKISSTRRTGGSIGSPFEEQEPRYVYTDQICVDTMNGDNIGSDPYVVTDGKWGSFRSSLTATGSSQTTPGPDAAGFVAESGSIKVLQEASGANYQINSKYESVSSSGKTWNGFINEIITAMSNSKTFGYSYRCMSQNCTNGYGSITTTFEKSVPVDGESASMQGGKFSGPDGKRAIAFLYGYSGKYSDPPSYFDLYVKERYLVTQQERVHLYMYYFETILGAKISCSATQEQALGNKYGGPIKWFSSGQNTVSKECYITNHETVSKSSTKVNAVDDAGYFNGQIGYNELLEFFKTLSIETLDDAAETGEDAKPADPLDTDPATEKEQRTCYTHSGSLGWILCPIIEQLADAIQKIYEAVIEPFLYLDTELFATTDKSGNAGDTYTTWGTFRDLANLGFIIFFIIVIFSQLTGVGIDNYGIKKILPKLIIGAVLINLSYIICQFAVDISNILGYAMQGVFNALSNKSFPVTVEAGGFTETAEFVGGTAIIVFVIGLICVGTFLAIGPEVIIPVFLALISIVIGIIFCFVLLVVRKAFAVILVIVSPLAFMCYILPNTKSLFDKWLNSFKAVLLAFPICSAMIYGGQFVGRLLISASASTNVSLPMALSAAVISIVPIFLIPTALRSALGAIGNMIGRFQGGISRGARASFLHSGYAQERRMDSMRYRAGYDRNGNKNLRGRIQDARYNLAQRGMNSNSRLGRLGGRLAMSQGAARRLNMRRAGAINMLAEQSADTGQFMGAGGEDVVKNKFASAQRAADERVVKETEASIINGNRKVNGKTISANSVSDLRSGLTSALRSNDKTAIKAYQNLLTSKGDVGREAVRQAMVQAQKDGGVSAEAIQTYSTNIMDNYSKDYKENNRSTFDFAKDTQVDGMAHITNADGSEQIVNAEMANYVAGLGSMKGATLGAMDDDEFARSVSLTATDESGALTSAFGKLQTKINNGETLTQEEMDDYNGIRSAAYEALHSDNSDSIKVDRKAELEKVAGDFKPKEVLEQEAAQAEAKIAQQKQQQQTLGAINKIREQVGKLNVQHGGGSVTKVAGAKWEWYQKGDQRVKAMRMNDGTLRSIDNKPLDANRWKQVPPTPPR